MQIATVGQQMSLAATQRVPEAKEVAGRPDRDGDGDDRGVSAVKSAPSQGVGSLLDMVA